MNSNLLFTLFGISIILLLQTDFINANGAARPEVDSDESGPLVGDVSVPDVQNNGPDGPQHLHFNEEDTSDEEGPSLSEGVSKFGDNNNGTDVPQVVGENEEGVSEFGDNINGTDGPQVVGDNEEENEEGVSEFGDNINGTDGPQGFSDNEEENEEGVSNRLGAVSGPIGQNTLTSFNEKENESIIGEVPNLDTNINDTDENSDAGFDTRKPISDDGMPESDGHPKGLTSGHLTKKLKGIAKTLKRMQKSLSDFFSSLGR